MFFFKLILRKLIQQKLYLQIFHRDTIKKLIDLLPIFDSLLIKLIFWEVSFLWEKKRFQLCISMSCVSGYVTELNIKLRKVFFEKKPLFGFLFLAPTARFPQK